LKKTKNRDTQMKATFFCLKNHGGGLFMDNCPAIVFVAARGGLASWRKKVFTKYIQVK